MATQTPPGTAATEAPLRLRFDAFELDEADARLTRDGQPIAIAPRPFAVLCALARSPRMLVTKDALLDTVWGHRFVTDSVLKTTVSALRAALDDDAKQPRFIETVSRRGYRFIASTGAQAAPPPAASPALVVQPAAPPASPITGRTDALERLRTAWALACAGKRQVVWIAGEPGVGKTTLIDCFAAEARAAHCARGQCVDQGGTGEAYLPVLEALAELCRRDASFAPLLRSVAPMWLLQLPWLTSAMEREGLRRELAGSGQARMLRELGELLDRYTSDKPLLLVTEDLHWSDHGTRELIDHLARRRGPAQLLWLASFRLTEVIAADHPLKALRNELKLHGLSDEIVLDSFAETEVADYVAKRLPALASDENFVRALHARTDGLPLFVADVVSDLAAERAQAIDEPASALARLTSIAVPETLTGVVGQYVEQLPPDERKLLEAASVCGMEFRLSTLAQVLESDLATVARPCAELARRQRWLIDVPLEAGGSTSDTRYAFRHALYREVLHAAVGPIARAELHRRIAYALERESAEGADVTPAELAAHFELGQEAGAALRYYAQAAESAMLHFNPAQTMSVTERALALLPAVAPNDARTSIEITLATLRGAAAIQSLGIGADEVAGAFERALSLLDDAPGHPLRGLFLSALGFSRFMRGEPEAAHALAQRCERLSAQNDDPTALLCACLLHGLVQHLRGRPRIVRRWLEQGLAAHEGLDATTSPAVFAADPDVIILGYLGLTLIQTGNVDEGRARIREAHERSHGRGEPAPRMAALWFEALAGVRLGDAQGVAEAAGRLRALSEEYGLAQGHAAHLWFGGWAEAQIGDAREGHRLIRKGYEEARRLGIRAWSSETLAYAADARARAGEWRGAREELESAMRCADEIGEREYMPQLLLLDAHISDALREPDRAHDALRHALAEARAQEASWVEMLVLTAQCERAHVTARDRASLRRVLAQISGGADSAPVARARAAAGVRRG